MVYQCKSPVVLIFFNRPDTFEKVFEEVRKAKPSMLFLVQDGPRSEKDIPGITACRSIAESVNWECEVIRDYSDVNLGCGVRPQSGITNALKQVEEVIILEDDCVPSQSFFRYCDELLEKYKNDSRVAYISGLNHFEEWNCGESDYFFTKSGAIWGWATWRRAWDNYDYNVVGMNDEYILELTKKQITNKFAAESRMKSWIKASQAASNGEKLSYWDAQWGFVKYSQNMLVAVPKKNLIHNIGVGATSTHAQNLVQTSYVKYKNFVFIPTYEFEFPLKHPKCCVCDVDYDNLVYKCSIGNPVRHVLAKFVKKLIRRQK